MRDNAFKTFVRNTYKTSSPIPYIISIQVGLFILTLLFGIIANQGSPGINWNAAIVSSLSLPAEFGKWLSQPWSILSHPFVYTDIFSLLFQSLWLYWVGNMFLNFLDRKYFLLSFIGGLLVGAISFLALDNIPFLGQNSTAWSSITFGLASILGSLLIISPKSEVRLMLFGNVSLKAIALIYFMIELIRFISNNQFSIALSFALAALYGVIFVKSLRNGNDWSTLFNRENKRHLKVVHRQNSKYKAQSNEPPNQEMVDQILDKISEKGYDSLNAHEKEVLFKASKKN